MRPVPVPAGELPRLDRAVDAHRAARGHPRAAVPVPPDHRARRPARFEDDTLQSCAGAAIFLNNSGETCYTGWTQRHQELLHDAPEATRGSVFETQLEFLAHHRRGPDRNRNRRTESVKAIEWNSAAPHTSG